MFRSATFKLTLYYLVIAAVISIGFSSLVYQVAADDLAYGLHRQTQRISDDFPVFSGSPYLQTDAELAAAKRHIIGRLLVSNVLVLLLAGYASYFLARRTLQPIEDSHQLQQRFVADVSHELRTPLTALTMESEVVLLDPSASKQQLREVIGSSVEEANKLNALVNNLLKLSRLEQQSESPEKFVTVHVADPLLQAIERLRPVAISRRIALDYKVSSIDHQVIGDTALLEQLFVILLDNAVKYSPDGATVTITAAERDGMVRVSVQDTGRGIERAALEHVFERFYRADSARSSAQGGFGLGLSIARLITDNHHGSIELTSRPGAGTIATVILPAVRATQITD